MRLQLIVFVLLLMPISVLAGGLPFSHYGILDTPSSSLLKHTEVSMAVGGSAYSIEDSSGTSDMNVAVAGYLEIGLFGRGQIGGSYLGAGGFSGTARGLLLIENLKRPGITIGVENITNIKNYEFYQDSNDSLYDYPNAQNFSIYGLITKDLSYYISLPIRLNIGFGSGRFTQSSLAVDGLENPMPGVFGSIQVNPSLASEIVLEWDGRDLNAGGYYQLTRNFTVLAAASELEHMISTPDSANAEDVMQHPKFTVAIQINLGPFFGRTELDPYERLRFTEDDEALEALEEYRARAREEIQEIESTIR